MAHDPDRPVPVASETRIVRRFRPADSAAISGILRDSAEAAHWPLESYANLAASPGGLLLVSELPASNQLAGFIAARSAADEAEILNLAVHPLHRRSGVASGLLSAALDLFRQAAISRVFLELRASNLPARGLYQRFGFTPTGSRPAYYREPTEDAQCMQKILTTAMA